MAEDSEDQQPAAGVVRDSQETGAIMSVAKIKARDLTPEHVGNFVFGYNPEAGAKVPAKILRVRHVNEGDAPGVSVLLRMPTHPDGTPAHNVPMHVPFDHEFELVEIVGY